MNIHRGAQGTVRLATASEHFGGDAARDHLAWRATPTDGYRNLDATTARMDHCHTTSGIWPDCTPEELAWPTKLDTMPQIEQAGVTPGIGIATGADTVCIQRQATVEPDRMIPMATPDAVRGPGSSGPVNTL